MIRIRSFIILILSAISLTACQNRPDSQPAEQSSAAPQTEQPVQSSSAPAEEAESSITSQGDYYSVAGQSGEVIIVNKKYPLSETYAPGENAEAKAALLNLIAAMRAEGYAVSDRYSGFRSYADQAALYAAYADSDGQEKADRYSARPGYSEHQTGLAFDLLDTSGALLEEPAASAWLSEHAADYGFVVRYPSGKEAVTGYMAESWHIRYIGEEAKAIYASGLTLEEYYGVEGGGYAQ